MSAKPKPKTKPLVGIEFVHDTYFDTTAVRFGTGKETLQLAPNKAKRILTAVQLNGVDAVIAALQRIVEEHDPTWKPAGAKIAKDTVAPKPKPQPKPKPKPKVEDNEVNTSDDIDIPPELMGFGD
jgi:hypothetical protein